MRARWVNSVHSPPFPSLPSPFLSASLSGPSLRPSLRGFLAAGLLLCLRRRKRATETKPGPAHCPTCCTHTSPDARPRKDVALHRADSGGVATTRTQQLWKGGGTGTRPYRPTASRSSSRSSSGGQPCSGPSNHVLPPLDRSVLLSVSGGWRGAPLVRVFCSVRGACWSSLAAAVHPRADAPSGSCKVAWMVPTTTATGTYSFQQQPGETIVQRSDYAGGRGRLFHTRRTIPNAVNASLCVTQQTRAQRHSIRDAQGV
jgi:hypothetical protein